VNRPTDAIGSLAAKIFPSRSIPYLFLAAALCFAAGCKKKSAPPSSAGIRNITREFVFAAQNASAGRAEVGIRPEYEPRQPGRQQALAADHIYITVPATKMGAADKAAHDSIVAELERVAAYHHLQRVQRPGAPGLERFDYLMDARERNRFT
jgi:hypothetical protein